MQQQLTEKDQQEENLRRQLREMEQQQSNPFRDKEDEMANLQRQITTQERQLGVKDQQVNELEITLSLFQRALSKYQEGTLQSQLRDFNEYRTLQPD